MPRKIYWLVVAIVGSFSLWCALSILLLLYGNDWWLSGLTTVTVFAWLGGLLVVLYQQGRVRAAATGAVLASATYWLLVFGPWFSSNIGPTLLPSRGLAQLDVVLHGNPQQVQTAIWSTVPPQPVYLTGSGVISGNTLQTGFGPQSYAVVNTAPASSGTVFQSLGHWLLLWLCAGLGCCAALWMQICKEKRTVQSSTTGPGTSNGESPFASPGVAP